MFLFNCFCHSLRTYAKSRNSTTYQVNLGIFHSLYRYRPAGACPFGEPRFYTDSAPLGLRFLSLLPLFLGVRCLWQNQMGNRVSTQIPPRWGCVFCHFYPFFSESVAKSNGEPRFYTDSAPLGLRFLSPLPLFLGVRCLWQNQRKRRTSLKTQLARNTNCPNFRKTSPSKGNYVSPDNIN